MPVVIVVPLSSALSSELPLPLLVSVSSFDSDTVAIGGILAVVEGKHLKNCGIPYKLFSWRLPKSIMSVAYNLAKGNP